MIAGPENPNGDGDPPPARTSGETLSYISDIVRELKQMAEKAGYKTLAAILSMAQAEARLQADEFKRHSPPHG